VAEFPQAAVTWMFSDGARSICVQRVTDRHLVVSSDGAAERRFQFADISELMAFQIGFEDHLLATGWRLEGFSRPRRIPTPARLLPLRWRLRWRSLRSLRAGSAGIGWLMGVWRRTPRP